jgi:hypothetical protein
VTHGEERREGVATQAAEEARHCRAHEVRAYASLSHTASASSCTHGRGERYRCAGCPGGFACLTSLWPTISGRWLSVL